MCLSICILTHNQPELLPLCVAACVTEIERSHVQGEIIIVDNASRDLYPQRLGMRYPQVKVIRNGQNLGFAAANNDAIRQSQGRHVLVLNDDAVLQENSLGVLLGKLNSNQQIGAVGPKLLNPDGSVQRGFSNKRAVTLRSLASEALYLNDVFDKWTVTRSMLTRMGDDDVSGEAAEVAGACLLARRTALDQVGLFDESFYYSSEDTDLCYRLRKAGWKVLYVAEAQVTHCGSASFGKLEKLDRTQTFYRSQMHLLKKYWSPARYQMAKVVLSLVFLLRAPLAFTYRIWRRRRDLEGARESASIALRMSRWLMMDCD